MQEKNGSASEVITFGPVGYSTSQNAGDSLGVSTSVAGRSVESGWIGLAVGVIAVGSAMMIWWVT